MAQEIAESGDPFLQAGWSLLQHGAQKTLLLEALQARLDRFEGAQEELQLLHAAQDESVKASAVQRKLYTSLQGQCEEQRRRRDRLRKQRAEPTDLRAAELQALVTATRGERAGLAAEVSTLHEAKQAQARRLAELRVEVDRLHAVAQDEKDAAHSRMLTNAGAAFAHSREEAQLSAPETEPEASGDSEAGGERRRRRPSLAKAMRGAYDGDVTLESWLARIETSVGDDAPAAQSVERRVAATKATTRRVDVVRALDGFALRTALRRTSLGVPTAPIEDGEEELFDVAQSVGLADRAETLVDRQADTVHGMNGRAAESRLVQPLVDPTAVLPAHLFHWQTRVRRVRSEGSSPADPPPASPM